MTKEDKMTIILNLIEKYPCESYCRGCKFMTFKENSPCALDQLRTDLMKEKFKNLKKGLTNYKK